MAYRPSSSPDPVPTPKPVTVVIPATFFAHATQIADRKQMTIPDWVRALVQDELFHNAGRNRRINIDMSEDLLDQLTMLATDDTRDVQNMVLHLIRTACAAAIAKRNRSNN